MGRDDRLEPRHPGRPRRRRACSPRATPRRSSSSPGPPRRASGWSSAYTGLAADTLPAAEAVGREEWIDANLVSLGGVLDPVASRLGEGMGALGGPDLRRDRRAAGRRGGRDLRLPGRARAGPVRVPRARPARAGPAAVRGAQPRPRGGRAGRRRRPAAALGRAARDHARAAVRRRAVAARAHGGDGRRAARRRSSVDPQAAAEPARRRATSAACATPCARAAWPRSCSAPSSASVFDRMQAFMAVLEGYAEHVMDAVGAEALDGPPDAARRAGPPPRRALGLHARARAPDRDGPQAAPVQAGQGVLRRRRRPRRHRRRSTASGAPPRRCRPSPSSRIRPAGCAAPSRPSSTAPPERPRAAPAVGIRTSVRTAYAVLGLFRRFAGNLRSERNPGAGRVYKHVFAGYSPCRTDLELISLVRDTTEGEATWPPRPPRTTGTTTTTDTPKATHRS